MSERPRQVGAKECAELLRKGDAGFLAALGDESGSSRPAVWKSTTEMCAHEVFSSGSTSATS